jgi:nucleoside-diphosphate-sugar epimerase
MTILITGSMGHVGFEVVRQAAARGHAIVAQYRGTFRQADAKTIQGNVQWVRCDLTSTDDVAALLKAHAVEGCIHTAAVPNEIFCRPEPLNAVNVNVTAVATLLDAARVHKWRRLIYVSTGSVFQNATDVTKPIYEDTQQAATTIYSTTKYCGELLTTMYRSQFNVPAATVRISWVYGPPLVTKQLDPSRGPIPFLLRCAIAGIPVREKSGGDFGASFTYVSDVAGGLIAAYEAQTLNHDIYHLGSGVNYTSSQVATAIKAVVPGADIEIGPGTSPWTDNGKMRGPLSGDRLFKDSGWRPSYTLDTGIKAFADWMREHPESVA